MEKFMPIILVFLCSLVNFSTSFCVEKERMTSFLDGAVDLLTKAKSKISCENDGRALDCSDLYKRGFKKSGVYAIYPMNRLNSAKRLDVYCDMTTDGGGWTVIQRRGEFNREDDYFFKLWEDYKKGFGDLEKDFWIGNDNMFAITNQRPYSVRFDLEDRAENKSYAKYESFWIDDEFNDYTLHISGYSGEAGNAMVNHDKKKFGTKDHYHNTLTGGNCATEFGSGWWFSRCYLANLNGKYNRKTYGIAWKTWKKDESLVKSEIKIRPAFH